MTVTVVADHLVYSVVLMEYNGEQRMLQTGAGAAAWTTAVYFTGHRIAPEYYTGKNLVPSGTVRACGPVKRFGLRDRGTGSYEKKNVKNRNKIMYYVM
ncbi:hypothetical protein ACI65C_008298 [Semiaphis heraclei]